MSQTILNIAGGKIHPIDFKEVMYEYNYKDMKFLLNLDFMYSGYSNEITHILTTHEFAELNPSIKIAECFCDMDIYEFLEKYPKKFDGIAMYRFLEHVPKTKILYFLYILSTTIKIGGVVDVIVPDYKKLAIRILEENVKAINFEAEDIITTFELLNEPESPHCSIWTEERICHFWELEGRFKINCLKENYKFDGRDIYLRFLAERVK